MILSPRKLKEYLMSFTEHTGTNDISTKKLLYIAWVCLRLEYASVVWSPYTKRNINNLEQVQRRALVS